MTSFFKCMRKLDLYGMYMSLNYKGVGSHNTWLGIIFSLVHIVAISSYGTDRFLRMYNRADPETSMNELYYDLENETPFYAKDLMFDLAFTIMRPHLSPNYWLENLGN